jgi:16S rRNA (guanine966-N2)-methyltransferase
LRVIAGTYRGRRLKSPPSSSRTRPTSDRLRETLFNVLAGRINGARFLDLCAGSGAVGVEAMSRGATHVTFVERSRPMRTVIEANLSLVAAPPARYEVVTSEDVHFLQRVAQREVEPWHLIFFDPPYEADYSPALNFLGTEYNLLTSEGLLVVEHHSRNNLPGSVGRLRLRRRLKQGDSALSFYDVLVSSNSATE